MLDIGRFNELTVLRQLPRGLQLDGGTHGEILLPKQYTTEEMKVGDNVNVFIYRDSEDRLIATTQTPLAMVGDFAYLNVVDESPVGAFLDIGLQRDILVPFSEQSNRLEKGRKVLVRIYLDDSDRLTASTKLDTFLYDTDETSAYKTGDEVNIIIGAKTDLGIKVVVDGIYWGLIYHSDVFQPLNRGDKLTAFVKRVREDQKIEIIMQKPGFARVEGLAGDVLELLTKEGGFIPLSDKSSPEDIKKKFNCSKNSYKQAIGTLYKQRLIRIEKDGIYLLSDEDK
jgi:predicted RNA-binding protein (virulence factor B family)